jgi:hypothetical protein
MQRLALVAVVLAGCLDNPTVEVDTTSLELARGTSHDVLVSIDGSPVLGLDGIAWWVEDPRLATVVPAPDGRHLRIGGDVEGTTIVHVNTYGQDVAITTRIGPPTLLRIWTEPAEVHAALGSLVQLRAKGVDTIARVQDITFDSRWSVRDSSVIHLDAHGMMLQAIEVGQTSLHVTNGMTSTVVPVTIFK